MVLAILALARPVVADTAQRDSDVGAIDTVKPTAVISLVDPTTTDLNVVHFSVDFSKSVGTTFDEASVSLTSALSGTVAVGGTDPNYTVTVTLASPNPGGPAGIRIDSSVRDAMGNAYAGDTSPQYQILPTSKVPVAGLTGLGAVFGLVACVGARKLRKK
jgi:hypothetical protein